MKKRIFAVMMAGLIAAGCLGPVSVNAEETESESYEDIISDVPYIDDGNEDHMVDLYGTGSVSEETPVIIEIHGGGHIGGNKTTNTDHSIYYAQHGYTVVNPDYSKLPDVTFKEAIQELFTVYQWVADNAEEYHFDLDNVILSGDSAGGYYVLISAAIMSSEELQDYFEVELPSYEVKGYVTTCPETDVMALRDSLGKDGSEGYTANTIGEEILMDDDLMGHLDLYSVIDPETYPYVYMMTTPEDQVTGEQVLKFDEFLTENGIAHELHSYENKSNELYHCFNILRIDWEESIEANDDIIAYMDGLCGRQ